jgi:hypothetical protein
VTSWCRSGLQKRDKPRPRHPSEQQLPPWVSSVPTAVQRDKTAILLLMVNDAMILPIFLARIPCLLSLKKTPLPGQDSAAGMYWPKIKLKRTQPGRGLELSDQSSPGPTPATAEPARKPGLGLV